eukprot:TRINITY_DN8985_c0_g1_i1.p1 TRINITY_DN8985_c0_g1~~TRINITY_DN8985_c0_g1_i1.p1  ORF type:complete len:272 (+),score=49.26 TRINITY_DN8985_c0_g1_i1:95-817(+)
MLKRFGYHDDEAMMALDETHFEISTYSFDLPTKKIELKIRQILLIDYGLYVWPSAFVLAEYIVQNHDKFVGKHIVELGAGTCLPGLVCSAIGAKVTLTDRYDNIHTLSNCEKILDLNKENLFTSPKIHGLTWGMFHPHVIEMEKVDYVIGADLFYDEKDFDDVFASVAFFFYENPDCIFITTYQERDPIDHYRIHHLLRKWKLQLETIDSSFYPQEKIGQLQDKSILLWKISPAQNFGEF